MSKKFKYQEDMDAIKNEDNCDCPAKELKAIVDFEAYRYVFEDINFKNNFLPQLKSDPSRFIDASGNKKCSYLSLSMYSELQNAKKRYTELANTFKNFSKTVGTHIAKGVLDANDGLITNEDANTHFELYEFEDADLKSKFKILEKI